MSKHYYWVSYGTDDFVETSMRTDLPLVTLATATRDKTDTLRRFVYWAQLLVTVGGGTLPSINWVDTAAVDWLSFFDTESDGHAVSVRDDDPHTVGFSRLVPSVYTTTTTGKYKVLFTGPPQGIDIEAGYKGYSASNRPSLSAQRWVSDGYGVFDNFTGFSVVFSSRLIGRALWASDLPAAP